MNGGELIARVLEEHGVRCLFTLCGGHISPILVGAKARGIRVVDTRHEVDAVFAADAMARLTGVPGVAAVTAGPGCTNTVTAVKNAQMAQSPVLLLGGATGTFLKGRGSLQDIDQLALFAPHVKWATTVSRVKDLPGAVTEALRIARSGVPGPTFVECPVDLLYDESLVREWYTGAVRGKGIRSRLARAYLKRHADRLFAGAAQAPVPSPRAVETPSWEPRELKKAAARLRRARRPVLVVGSQALLRAVDAGEVAAAVRRLGLPTYLGGGARGLLGAGEGAQLHLRHQRRKALKEADLVILAGFPSDFRLDYGRQVAPRAFLIGVNRSEEDLYLNRKPSLAVLADPGAFLQALAAEVGDAAHQPEWLAALRQRDAERDASIAQSASQVTEGINPLALCRAIEEGLGEDSVLVMDGGDFVATASYIVRPRGPLCWLDPGPFGTLGVGGGFALGAKLVRPSSEIWLLYGDGSCAYSLAEFDTFVRHGLSVIAVVGNDASWRQIAREQVDVLKDDVGTVLRHSDYHRVAEGYGGRGLLLERPEDIPGVLAEARRIAASGEPVLINAILGKTDFRKGSISM